MTVRRLGVLVLASALFGCSGDGPESRSYTLRDSAGIAIVESFEPAWRPGEEWAILPTPDVVVGALDGDERYLLNQVWGLRGFEDGRIAVLDYGSSRVRVYDGEGRHLVDVGGPGEGPAEFDRPQYVDVRGDTIVVVQSAPIRVSWFDMQGDLLDALTVPSGSAGRPLFGWPFGRFDDGSFAMAVSAGGAPSDRPGRARERGSIWRLTLDPPGVDSLLALDMEEVVVHASGGWNGVTFGRTTWHAADRDAIHSLETGRFEIRTYDPAGRLVRILRRPWQPQPVTQEHKLRFAEQLAAVRQLDPEQTDNVIASLDQPNRSAELLPAARLLAVDRVGNLWVENFDDVGIEIGRFSVFSAAGVWLGNIDLPPGLPWLRGRRGTTLDIDDHSVLSVWTDDLGVEQVRRYRIDKPSPSSP